MLRNQEGKRDSNIPEYGSLASPPPPVTIASLISTMADSARKLSKTALIHVANTVRYSKRTLSNFHSHKKSNSANGKFVLSLSHPKAFRAAQLKSFFSSQSVKEFYIESNK